MPDSSVCPSCGAALPMRDGKPAKFCPRCGGCATRTEDAPQSSVTERGDFVPRLASPTQPVVAPSALAAPIAAPTPRPIALPVPTDPLAEETAEVASWRWNWGAFLVPGIWMLGNRVKPRIVPMVILGVPAVLLGGGTAINLYSAMTSQQNGSPAWSNAMTLSILLLIVYAVACLSSIRPARYGSLEAWRAFPSQRLPQFRTAQRIWSVAGFALLSCLIWANWFAQSSFQRAVQEQFATWNRQSVMTQGSWVWTDSSGKNRIVYRFSESTNGHDGNCQVQINGGSPVLARFSLSGMQVSVMSSDPRIGTHNYVLSTDEQTLSEIDGNGRTFRKAP